MCTLVIQFDMLLIGLSLLCFFYLFPLHAGNHVVLIYHFELSMGTNKVHVMPIFKNKMLHHSGNFKLRSLNINISIKFTPTGGYWWIFIMPYKFQLEGCCNNHIKISLYMYLSGMNNQVVQSEIPMN